MITNAISIVQHVIQMKMNNDTCKCRCKKYRTCKIDYSWNPSTCICENSRYLKHAADDSVIVCDEIINAANILSANMINAIPTNMTNSVPINVTNTITTNLTNTIPTNMKNMKNIIPTNVTNTVSKILMMKH